MIEDVDESLRALVRRDAVNGSGVEVAFDAPTKDWAARRNTPTVDLYLYDIREDLQRRDVAWEEVRDKAGRVTERRPPPRRFKLSYLVTAWTQRPEDEHRLLSTLLGSFIRNETVPQDLLAGALAGTDLPVFLTIALPPPADRSLSDVWTALGGELKPSLDLVVTAPLVDTRVETPGPPVLEEPKIRLGGEAVVRPSRQSNGAQGGSDAGGAGRERRRRRRFEARPGAAAARLHPAVTRSPAAATGPHQAASLGHLLGRLDLVADRVRAAVEMRRASDPDPLDRFRGLHISAAQVESLLSTPTAPLPPDPGAAAQLERLEREADAAEGSGSTCAFAGWRERSIWTTWTSSCC